MMLDNSMFPNELVKARIRESKLGLWVAEQIDLRTAWDYMP